MNPKELHSQLEAKSAELSAIFAEHTDEAGAIKSTLPVDEVKNRKTELDRLTKDYSTASEMETIRRETEASNAGMKSHDPRRPLFGAGRASDNERGAEHVATKSVGEIVIEDDAFKSFAGNTRSRGGASVSIPGLGVSDAFKATFTTAGATLTQFDRQAGMVMLEQQRLTITDLLARGETMMNTIRFVREDTYTNAATTVAEGAAKPEASFDLSEADAPVRKIAVVAKVTDELMADFPAVRDYINNRLRFMVAEREEAQILNGSGVAPNLTGILTTSGILTQAIGVDTALDAIHKGATKIRVQGHFEPDGIVIHPNDWQDLRLAKDSNLQYFGGGPFYAPYGNGAYLEEPRLWGLRPVITTAITEGTALVGAFKLGAQVFFRNGITLETTNSNEDDFKNNLVAIRAEERLALAVYRPKAFATITGI